MKTLSASDLLAGGELVHEVRLPDNLLEARPMADDSANGASATTDG